MPDPTMKAKQQDLETQILELWVFGGGGGNGATNAGTGGTGGSAGADGADGRIDVLSFY